jgi:hypothetical protein
VIPTASLQKPSSPLDNVPGGVVEMTCHDKGPSDITSQTVKLGSGNEPRPAFRIGTPVDPSTAYVRECDSTLALFVALGGGAFAASKFVGPGRVVRLCVSPGGAVRVLKVGQKCGRGKTEVPVDQTGPQGVPGSRGQTGSQGPPGPQGNGANYTAGTA